MKRRKSHYWLNLVAYVSWNSQNSDIGDGNLSNYDSKIEASGPWIYRKWQADRSHKERRIFSSQDWAIYRPCLLLCYSSKRIRSTESNIRIGAEQLISQSFHHIHYRKENNWNLIPCEKWASMSIHVGRGGDPRLFQSRPRGRSKGFKAKVKTCPGLIRVTPDFRFMELFECIRALFSSHIPFLPSLICGASSLGTYS